MSNQDKHKIAATLKNARNYKLLSRKSLIFMPTAAMLGMLALVAVFFASADLTADSYATSVNSEVTAEIDGTHYVTLSAPDVTFSINPTSSAQLSKQNINVSVETNAPGGADLYLAMSGSTNALHLNGDTTSTTPAIEATAAPVAASSLAANTWGYSTDDQTYSAVPTSDSDPALLAAVDGSSVGSSAGGVITASVPVYFAASVDTSIPSGSYSNRMTYSAVVDGGIITNATLTKIEIDGAEVENMQPEVENTLEITTNLMTNTYGTPRAYLETTSPAGYQECGSVVVSRNESGYMTITCKVTPSQAATGVTLHIVPKGSSDDRFCTDNTYQPDTSDCESGEWKWGSFVVEAPDIVAIFNGITTMQEMTPEVCAAAAENDTVQLQDTRDGKYYWVAKLADGNCWMTQNLELSLEDVTLTPETSNVTSNWTPGISMYTRSDEGARDNTAIQAWDLGNYVWTSPDIHDDSCGSIIGDLSYCPGQFTEVSNMTAMTKSRTDGVVIEGNTYDAHYKVGYYYSWNAATAATVPSYGIATESICPSNWQLPYGASSTADEDTPGSIDYLLSQYGLTAEPTSDATGYSIMRAPLYFVHSGYIWPSYLYSNTSGFYWLSRASSSTSAYSMYFSNTTVNASDSTYRYRYGGQAVRCVADWE